MSLLLLALLAAEPASHPASQAVSSPSTEMSVSPTLPPPLAKPRKTDRDRLMEYLDYGIGMKLDEDWFTGNLGIVLRPRLTIPLAAAAIPMISMSMIRPQIRATAWQKRIKLFIQPEFADSARILDAEVSVLPLPWLGVRVGRFVTPFSRTFVTPVPRLKFPDFSASDTFFRVDRDIGGTLFGSVADKHFDYEVGVLTGGSFVPGPLDKGLVMVMGRVSGHPLGLLALDENQCRNGDCVTKISFGLQSYYRAIEIHALDATQTNVVLGVERQVAAGLDFAFTSGRFQLQGEVFYRLRDRAADTRLDQMGAYLHASFAIIRSWLEFAARGDFIDANLHGGSDRIFDMDLLLTTNFLGRARHALGRLRLAHARNERARPRGLVDGSAEPSIDRAIAVLALVRLR